MISNIGSQPKAYVGKLPQGDNSSEAKKAKEVKPTESDRVSTIKEQIQNGQYSLNTSKTAQAVAEEMIG